MKSKLLIQFIFFVIAIPSNCTAQSFDCNLMSLPSITFRGNATNLNSQAKAILLSAATIIKQNPQCRISVQAPSEASKAGQQRSWDRVNAVIRYLVEQTGISEERLIFQYGESEGDFNMVDLMGTTEQGADTKPPPHPNLRGRH